MRGLRQWIVTPCDGAGLAAFRAAFGFVMLVATVRFWARGWIDELYLQPQYHFTYLGFEWVRPWPGPWLYVHFSLMALAALGVCVGLWARLSAGAFCVLFVYAELLEKAAYLNHYYLVSLIALLLAFVPAAATGSIDAWIRRRRGAPARRVTNASYALLRVQLGLVYFFAGLAKLNSDWLVRAEPLSTWLSVRADVALFGPLLAEPVVAHAMSYFGALFDLTVAGFLSWKRTRLPAFAVLVLFHLTVWLLFPIGMFSFVMVTAATIFFSPSWPRQLAAQLSLRAGVAPVGSATPVPAGWLPRVAGAGYLVAQLLLPLRFLLYPPGVNWHEQGFRFAWRVMLVEKAGQVRYRIEAGPRHFVVYPRKELTPLQYTMMSTQPDMIHEYALELKRRFEARLGEPVRVFAEAWVSFNGRPRARLIDPAIDLGAEPRTLSAKPWILPQPESST